MAAVDMEDMAAAVGQERQRLLFTNSIQEKRIPWSRWQLQNDMDTAPEAGPAARAETDALSFSGEVITWQRLITIPHILGLRLMRL